MPSTRQAPSSLAGFTVVLATEHLGEAVVLHVVPDADQATIALKRHVPVGTRLWQRKGSSPSPSV